uniref:WAP domain-containing protein n=1 Tax=Timema poppense TaxID=170557 RepID=A0A7R9HHA3_TIMPO|nr:unnamed protein product [Timema poppensis]
MAVTATSVVIVMVVVVDVMQLVSSQRKPGTCALNYGTNVCVKICHQDTDCSGSNKCCPTECGGTTCSRPITTRPRQNSETWLLSYSARWSLGVF